MIKFEVSGDSILEVLATLAQASTILDAATHPWDYTSPQKTAPEKSPENSGVQVTLTKPKEEPAKQETSAQTAPVEPVEANQAEPEMSAEEFRELAIDYSHTHGNQAVKKILMDAKVQCLSDLHGEARAHAAKIFKGEIDA